MGRDNNNAGMHLVRHSLYGAGEDLQYYDNLVAERHKKNKTKATEKTEDTRKSKRDTNIDPAILQKIQEENEFNRSHPQIIGNKDYYQIAFYKPRVFECYICNKQYIKKAYFQTSEGAICDRCFASEIEHSKNGLFNNDI